MSDLKQEYKLGLIERIKGAIRQFESQAEQNKELGYEILGEGVVLPLMRDCLLALTSPKELSWDEAERISNDPDVFDYMHAFRDSPDYDSRTRVVQSIVFRYTRGG